MRNVEITDCARIMAAAAHDFNNTLLDFSIGSEVRPGAASMESLIESCEAAYLTAGVQ